MEYEIDKYKFVDTGSHVVVYRNGEKWGVPQGSRFLRVLLNEIKRLEEVIEDRTGDVVHLYEENERLKKGIKLSMKHTYDDDTHEFLDRLLKHDTKDVPDYRLKIE